MASAFYSEDLTCSICLTIFTDPVTLFCGHSFCRECISLSLSSQRQCPQCRTPVSTEGKYLPTNLILKSLAEKTKEAEKIKKEHGQERAEVAELCPEHEEKLKLFCITDQQLACIICRDGEKHEGHKFKPIKEAAESMRHELKKGMENLSGDIFAIESQANTQREEISKTKEKSQQLATQIHRQFEEMHQFLRKREDEIKNELKHKEEDAVEKMNKSLNVIETALSQSRELQGKMTSVLEIEDSERLLKSWTEDKVTAEQSFRPRGKDLRVENSSLSLGPYESHLQFFMWKEMLQVIQPRAELLSLKSTSTDITVSGDGRSLFSSPRSNQAQSGSSSAFGFSTQSYQTPASSGFGFSTQSFQTPASSGFGFGTQSFQTPASSGFGFGTQSFQTPASSGFGFGTKPPPPTPLGTFVNGKMCSTTHQAFSVSGFTSGQHYWEIEVGHRDYWELGIKDNFLKYDGQNYATCSSNITTELSYKHKLRKIGIYLNFSSKKLSFYDADNMKHIHTVSSGHMSTPLSAYFAIRSRNPDPDPLTVCWY